MALWPPTVLGTAKLKAVSSHRTPNLYLFRHHKRFSVFACEEFVRRRIVHKLFLLRIELQLRPDPKRRFLWIDTNRFRVFQKRHHAVADHCVVTEIRWLLVRPFAPQ